MSSNPSSALVDQFTAGWEQAQTAAKQWWDASWQASDQWWTALADSVTTSTGTTPSGPASAGQGQHKRGRHHEHGHHEHGHHEHSHHEHGGCGCGCADSGGCGCGGRHESAHGHPATCGCGAHDECRCDDPCACCVPRADVVVRVRAGERRIVPFTLRNSTRRDRPITLAVGPWQACGGDALEVGARFVEGEAITLGPCESRTVRLLLATAPVLTPDPKPDPKPDPATPAPKPDPAKELPTPVNVPGDHVIGVVVDRTGDVTRCSTAYADVRFEGCGRPMRVAIVVEPAACGAVEVPCGCGCC